MFGYYLQSSFNNPLKFIFYARDILNDLNKFCDALIILAWHFMLNHKEHKRSQQVQLVFFSCGVDVINKDTIIFAIVRHLT